MGWASKHIEALKDGKTVQFRPKGTSMHGKIESGQLVTVAPITTPLAIGNIVLCEINGRQYLHLISALNADRVQISNNKNKVNGWTSLAQIYGLVTTIEP